MFARGKEGAGGAAPCVPGGQSCTESESESRHAPAPAHRGLGLRLTASVGAQPLRRWAALPGVAGGEAVRATASVSVRPCCLCGPGRLQRLETAEEVGDKHVILGHLRSPRPRGLDLVLMGSSFEWEQCEAVSRPGRGAGGALDCLSSATARCRTVVRSAGPHFWGHPKGSTDDAAPD